MWGGVRMHPYTDHSWQGYCASSTVLSSHSFTSVRIPQASSPPVKHTRHGLLQHLYPMPPLWRGPSPDIQGLPLSFHSDLCSNETTGDRVPGAPIQNKTPHLISLHLQTPQHVPPGITLSVHSLVCCRSLSLEYEHRGGKDLAVPPRVSLPHQRAVFARGQHLMKIC